MSFTHRSHFQGAVQQGRSVTDDWIYHREEHSCETREMEDHRIGVSLVSWLLWKEDEITQVHQQDILLG